MFQALAATPGLEPRLLHTGQHYDDRMSDRFLVDLPIPAPEWNLNVGSASHAKQTADIMTRFEPVLLEVKPRAVLVVGDVNSTIACALVAAKLGIEVIHVEAGLRSFDRSMPEEINRMLTDRISDVLFTTEPAGDRHLKAEGVDPASIHQVGNVMIDTLVAHLDRAVPVSVTTGGRVADGAPFAALTLHRPSNVDDPAVLTPLLDAIADIARDLPVIFPVHPRTRGRIEAFGLGDRLSAPGMIALEPLGYLEMLGLTSRATVVMTDSGGLQDETTGLGVPCLTLRENTERPITMEVGTSLLIGTDSDRLRREVAAVRAGTAPKGAIPPLWDGHAAERIAAILGERYGRD